MHSILIDEFGEAYYIEGKSTSPHCLGYTHSETRARLFCMVQNEEVEGIAPELMPPERDERHDPPEPIDNIWRDDYEEIA